MEATMMAYPLTLTSILERHARLFPDVEVVSRTPSGSIVRYDGATFVKRSRALSSALRKRGLKAGDRVATLMWNHSAHLEAYFGVPCAGGVLHTLNLRLHPDDIAYIANHAEDRFVIVDDVLLPLWQKVAPMVKVEQTFVVRWTDAPLPDGYQDYETLIAEGDPNEALPQVGENDAMGMCYTSGTTGKPKGVVYSHRSMCLHAMATCMVDTLAVSGRDAVLPVVPMFHANAWGLPFAAVLVGAKQVFPGPHLDAKNILDLFERERVSLAAGVPTVWLAIQQTLDAEPGKYDLVQGMRMVVGGSAAPESMIRAFDAHGLAVVHAWGMTELSPLGTVATVKASLVNSSSDVVYAARAKQGLPVAFVDVRGVDDRGEMPWDGTSQGELQVRGPWVASSYYALEGESDRWTADGWFRTGDVVTIDSDGYVKLTDRTKDLIKSGGEWISSVELENAIMGHPSVLEAAVVAVAHPKWVERPLAAIVLREGKTVTPAELCTFLESKVAKWWLPAAVVTVDAIPRTSTGKFLKTALRERFKHYPLPD